MKKEYKIVEKYSGFFSKWYFLLYIKVNWSFLFWKGCYWKEVGGNSLNRNIPDEWLKLNIVENIKLDIDDQE